MVEDRGEPQGIDLVRQNSSQHIPRACLEIRYFRFAVQLVRVLEFYGFRNILFTSIVGFRILGQESPGLRPLFA